MKFFVCNDCHQRLFLHSAPTFMRDRCSVCGVMASVTRQVPRNLEFLLTLAQESPVIKDLLTLPLPFEAVSLNIIDAQNQVIAQMSQEIEKLSPAPKEAVACAN